MILSHTEAEMSRIRGVFVTNPEATLRELLEESLVILEEDIEELRESVGSREEIQVEYLREVLGRDDT